MRVEQAVRRRVSSLCSISAQPDRCAAGRTALSYILTATGQCQAQCLPSTRVHFSTPLSSEGFTARVSRSAHVVESPRTAVLPRRVDVGSASGGRPRKEGRDYRNKSASHGIITPAEGRRAESAQQGDSAPHVDANLRVSLASRRGRSADGMSTLRGGYAAQGELAINHRGWHIVPLHRDFNPANTG